MATNNIRNKLFDNAVDLADEDGYIDEVDLTVQPWNRTTVADGQWLNDHAIKPLSSRDLFLADCIDAANLQIETISANLASIGVGGDGSGSSGTNGIVAGKLGRSNVTFSDNSDNMSEKSVARVPGGLADTIQPAYSLQYFGFGPQALKYENLPKNLIKLNKNAIIQANMHTGIASQIALTPSGMYYRGIEDSSPTNYEVRNPNDFLQVMMSPVLTADIAGVITYSADTNTFNIAALPAATTAVTGVSGSHLKLTDNKVCFASAFDSGKLYFVCETGFKEYTAPSFASSAPIQPTATGSNVYELKYTTEHFQTDNNNNNEFQLKLKTNGGIISDNGLCLSLSGLSAFSPAEVSSFTANGYITTQDDTITTPFITVNDPDDPNQGRLGVNVNFLLSGFAVKDGVSSLAQVITDFENRISALEN